MIDMDLLMVKEVTVQVAISLEIRIIERVLKIYNEI
tara:strand:- start:404 stop:511 length:108 start_codon:yes stop_codon:yes gene_type:complete